MEELEQIRFNIITLHNDGISLREIAKRLEIGLSKVRYCIKIWKEEHRISKKKRGVKKREFENDLKNFVLEETVENHSVFEEREKFGKKILIWGGISYYLQTELIVIEKSVNTETYINDIIKNSRVIKKANREYGCLNWIFQQDGARPHTSRKTMDFLNRRCQVMNTWPPNSPDLNPIENLWSIMDRRLKHVNPKNKEEFIEELINVWESIKWETLENLTLSMDNRINLVIERDGQSINGFF
ncbi:transposable element tc1 transposase [Anaeramoeba flamelloides]|uniref:Transposable element tc1 transposase n=1 Tax=Anaeramoeba flamelloides TaxID=1746091 RepID=A0AAV7ZCF7_9EUKA|nr:transposable element tc1 transposase [Anaeramoeba flamelloides]